MTGRSVSDLAAALLEHRSSACISRENSTIECECGADIFVRGGFDRDGYDNEKGAEREAILRHAIDALALNSDPDVALAVLLKHQSGGVIHSGENWLLCSCGQKVPVPGGFHQRGSWEDSHDEALFMHAATHLQEVLS